MKYTILFLVIMFLLPSVNAETTFFDQDDTFIMGNSPTGGVVGGTGTTGGTTSGGGCSYKWNCTNWSACISSRNQTRICTNIGTCPETYKAPEIEQNCTYFNPEPPEPDEKSTEAEENNAGVQKEENNSEPKDKTTLNLPENYGVKKKYNQFLWSIVLSVIGVVVIVLIAGHRFFIEKS